MMSASYYSWSRVCLSTVASHHYFSEVAPPSCTRNKAKQVLSLVILFSLSFPRVRFPQTTKNSPRVTCSCPPRQRPHRLAFSQGPDPETGQDLRP
jgi:hypothetical protein